MTNATIVETMTTASGKRWLKIMVRESGPAAVEEIKSIADANGIDRSAPGCRVVKAGKKIWKAYGPWVPTCFSNAEKHGYLVAGYWL